MRPRRLRQVIAVYNPAVHEILNKLSAESVVLDLGCGRGSFQESVARVVRVDLEVPSGAGAGFVAADSAHLPFPDASLDAVVCNHSLEHFDDLDSALKEIGRTIKPGGTLYVSVPDASTFTDRLYRWLARGGGHVNAFVDATPLIARIEAATGLRHVGTRPLFSSLSFLNRANRRAPAPRKLALLGGGAPASLHLYTILSRWADRWMKTRLSVYGWAFYFGEIAQPIDTGIWCNVCIRCGSATSSGELSAKGRVRKPWMVVKGYNCPICATWNPFFEDRHFQPTR